MEVREGGIASRGVFATAHITKGQWLSEYKGIVYPRAEMKTHVEEYQKNGEGSYIITSQHPVGGGTRLCWDASRTFNQLGRYINHTINPNAILSPPKYVRSKWRVGFLAAKDIDEGDEVVWDYGVHNEMEWGMCKMVEGLVVDDEDARMEGKVRVVSVTRTI